MKKITLILRAGVPSAHLPGLLQRPFAETTLLELALHKIAALEGIAQRFLLIAHEDFAIPHGASIELLRHANEDPRAPWPLPQALSPHLDRFDDLLFILDPCLPFVSRETLQSALRFVQESNFPSYTSGVMTRDWIFDQQNLPLTNSDPQNVTTNKGRFFYRAVHAFHVISKNHLLQHHTLWTMTQNDPHVIEIPEREGVAIRDEIEWEYAEYVFRERRREASASSRPAHS